MSEETLLTAARRLVRNVRADDAHHGGLLSRESVISAEMLDLQISRAKKREAKKQGGDRHG